MLRQENQIPEANPQRKEIQKLAECIEFGVQN